MKRLCLLPLLLLMASCQSITYNKHILVALHDIPAGTVVHRSDFSVAHGLTLHHDDVYLNTEDAPPSYEFSFKTVKALRTGQTLHWEDVEHYGFPQGAE